MTIWISAINAHMHAMKNKYCCWHVAHQDTYRAQLPTPCDLISLSPDREALHSQERSDWKLDIDCYVFHFHGCCTVSILYISYKHCAMMMSISEYLIVWKCIWIIHVTILCFFLDPGTVKFEAKTKTESGIKFTTNGQANMESGKALGGTELNLAWPDYGEHNLRFEIDRLIWKSWHSRKFVINLYALNSYPKQGTKTSDSRLVNVPTFSKDFKSLKVRGFNSLLSVVFS